MPMPALPPVTLLVVDDHNLFRRGLVALLGQDPGLKVVGEAGDAAQAMRLAPALRPDVILLDNHLPGVTGVDAIRGLREVSPSSRVLMLTVSEDAQIVHGALQWHRLSLKTIDGICWRRPFAALLPENRGQPRVDGQAGAAFQSQGCPGSPVPGKVHPAAPDTAISSAVAARGRRAARDCPGLQRKEIARALTLPRPR